MFARAPLGDHPRSRGVYEEARRSSHPARGSSPLARGLLPTENPGAPASWDHPRSRGVYTKPSGAVVQAEGSSPLARGLQGAGKAASENVWIIPARAGFTISRSPRPLASGDHPRSRGVYTGTAGDDACLGGSSPLARGLLASRRARLLARGIIPARAGFTARTRRTGSGSRDHPRSRGVYMFLDAINEISSGSSPLARGLPVGSPEPIIERRIIPARAGFTRCRCRSSRPHGDHPRSRGVYSVRVKSRSFLRGSSPLARGLPLVTCSGTRRSRIIPARAGFTTRATMRGTPSGDHPRSRGVYAKLL